MNSNPLGSGTSEQSQPVSPPQSPRELQRVSTGISGLDTILNGGLLQGGTYFVAGQPGTGKTILSNQIAFNHVASGGRVVFASVLSEIHDRMFAHLSSLSFFNPGPIGDTIYYISAYSAAEKEGLEGLLRVLQGAVRDNKATLLIVDGTLKAAAFAASDMQFKGFIHRLQSYAEVYGCTVLMLNSTGEVETSSPSIAAQTTVDGLIHLSHKLVGIRSVRGVHVEKFRGSAFMGGVHTLEITADGVQVYPRIEISLANRATRSDSVKAGRERLASGVEILDTMLHGGLLTGSSTVLLGPSGSGKTLLGLSFLAEGARQGQPGLYFGLNEPLELAIDAADQIGLPFSDLVETGQVQAIWQPALEESLDVIAHNLLAAVKQHSIQRLVIDGLDALDDINIHTERIPLFFTALMVELRRMGVTTVSPIELSSIFGPSADIPIEGVSARVENIIFLRTVELHSELQRIMSVLKTRRSAHEAIIRKFEITDQGIIGGDKLEGAEAILTGVARHVPRATE